MGLFSRRKQRESALPSAEPSPLNERSGEPVGEMVSGAGPQGFDLTSLPGMTGAGAAGTVDIGALLSGIGHAIQQGGVQVHVNPGQEQVVDLSGTQTGEQIKEIMRQHGIDPDNPAATNPNVDVQALQAAMMQAMQSAGADMSGFEGVPGAEQWAPGGAEPGEQDPGSSR